MVMFENVIAVFPEGTVFSNDNGSYYDVINFLQNARFKVSNEKLNSIALDKREEMVDSIHERLDILETLTEPLWGYDSQCDGWARSLTI